ncbi:MAG: LPXTG cell wall anchor domain-containing protein [Bdellovibrionales bacterium]|nr:LPXTG cell wall anchor domain-containing protein [Bdellovibrionales bacterium]
MSFEIPENWKCKSFEQNWVCHDKNQEQKLEALITVTAKIAGSFDTRDNYLKHLNNEKTWISRSQEEITSKKLGGDPKYIHPNKFPWVEGTHLSSEIKSYISRYVGTVCCPESSSQLGILVVLSAHETLWTKYVATFIKAINSLRVLNIEEAISKIRASDSMKSGDSMGSYIDDLLTENKEGQIKESSPLHSPFNLALLGIGALALGTFFLIKKRKNKKQKRLRRKRRRKKS